MQSGPLSIPVVIMVPNTATVFEATLEPVSGNLWQLETDSGEGRDALRLMRDDALRLSDAKKDFPGVR